MLNSIVKRIIKEDYWSFLGWYRDRFGFLPALLSYWALFTKGMGSAPNPLTGGVVYLRPGTADQHVYDQIFIAKEYDIDLGDPLFIVDAGAHIGISSVYFASKYPNAMVIAIEPESSNFNVLLSNVGRFRNIKPMPVGLWSRTTHLQLQDENVANWSFRVSEDFSGGGIPAVGIQDVMALFNIKHIDVLKIDIEGSELEVLQNSKLWVDAVSTLIIELHDRFQPGCSDALKMAFNGHSYDESRSAESVVINNIKRIAA